MFSTYTTRVNQYSSLGFLLLRATAFLFGQMILFNLCMRPANAAACEIIQSVHATGERGRVFAQIKLLLSPSSIFRCMSWSMITINYRKCLRPKTRELRPEDYDFLTFFVQHDLVVISRRKCQAPVLTFEF